MPSTELWRDTQKLERQGESEQSGAPGCTIWIDLDNSPHVPFFRPIIHVFFEQLGLPAPDGRADLRLVGKFPPSGCALPPLAFDQPYRTFFHIACFMIVLRRVVQQLLGKK